MQEALIALLTTILSIATLLILAKLMGNRQVSQLSMYDYIVGITIGSVAAEFAIVEIENWFKPLIAIILYGLSTVIFSKLTERNMKLRRFFDGKPIMLFENGKIYQENLKKAKIDVNEFLTMCRIDGYFNLDNIEAVIFETNGKLSILPKTQQRPVTPKDLNLMPQTEKMVANVIIDGKIMQENLKATGNNDIWLKNELNKQNIKNAKEVFLATCDAFNTLTVYKYTNDERTHTFFQ